MFSAIPPSNINLPLGNHLVHFPISWHGIMTDHYELDFIQFGYTKCSGVLKA